MQCMRSQVIVVEVFGGVHISIILIHPLRVIEVGHVFLQVVHDLVDVLTLRQHWHRVFLVEVILCIG